VPNERLLKVQSISQVEGNMIRTGTDENGNNKKYHHSTVIQSILLLDSIKIVKNLYQHNLNWGWAGYILNTVVAACIQCDKVCQLPC
jgi:hypothetical protein